ncbi:hypothetical protein HWV62_26803 [Athelia sp. TMB]|nr:hypothetical protein HWV62_26803 [Athelia sp. TMB]
MTVFISWFMVYIRRYYFAKKFEHIIAAELAKRAAHKLEAGIPSDDLYKKTPSSPPPAWPQRLTTLFRRRTNLSTVQESPSSPSSLPPPEKKEKKEKEHDAGALKKLRTDMIRRMDDAPRLVDPSGWVSAGQSVAVPMERTPTLQTPRQLMFADEEDKSATAPIAPGAGRKVDPRMRQRRLSDPGVPPTRSASPSGKHSPSPYVSPVNMQRPDLDGSAFQRYETMHFEARNRQPTLPRTTTIEFAAAPRGRRPTLNTTDEEDRRGRGGSLVPHRTLTRQSTRPSAREGAGVGVATKNTNFGGFPMPHRIAGSLIGRFFPGLQRRLHRTLTVPVTTTVGGSVGPEGGGTKLAPYLSFDVVVGRNSAFYELTNEQMEELGGVEYRGLNALLWLVAGLLAFIVIAAYISIPKWASIFKVPKQHRFIPSTWFAAFQVVSAYTNTGTSLVDQSMVPFQKAYPMIVIMIILILAGNTAFIIALTTLFTLSWIISKLVPRTSRLHETLQFLLDHPRRCFIYLFPSHQTWFLLTILVFLNCTDWLAFLVLDIGNPAIDYLPLGIRFVDGLLQAVAVRAAGFGTVSLAALSPAVNVRSTNVYEEKSLGVFRDDESYDEAQFEPTGSRMTVWSQYLAMHARKQLAFDMWWLGLALFLVCIVERSAINDNANLSWFNIFTIVFELVSAYGTVGLSLGIPTENYSFSGALRPLSKFIVCLVMLRGRHRGLPVAIDRAVMLPKEFQQSQEVFDDAPREDFDAGQTARNRSSPSPYSDSLNEKRNRSRESSQRSQDVGRENLAARGRRATYRADLSGVL